MSKPAPRIEGFEQGPASNGAVTCTGCWDASDHDINVDTTVPRGRPVYYRHVNIEYDEWDAYCAPCARQYFAWATG